MCTPGAMPFRPATDAMLMILPLPARDHAAPPHLAREEEWRVDVEVHDLVPGLVGVLLGGRAPGRAGVVDEDVDVAQAR